ncbi:Aldehyde/histidinol dehydrogenase [Xylariomycetidae sp. FL2044]|nr:Aldehyde/histidinol dehydrogenase [Xylariomycetidae sp. FL2044]
MLKSARQNGATFLVGNNGFLGATQSGLVPTIVTGVNPGQAAYDTEGFGPSASLYVVEDTAAAVRLANDSTYGLSAAVWTENFADAMRILRHLEYGQVHVNQTTMNMQPTMPASGFKTSGWGDSNSIYGIQQWLHNKAVSFHGSNSSPPS